MEKVIFCVLTVLTRKVPPYGVERHSYHTPSAAVLVDGVKRNSTYIGNTASSMQNSDWTSSRKPVSRYGRAVLSSNAGLSFDRPSHNYAAGVLQTRAEDGWVHRTPQHSGRTLSYYRPGTAVSVSSRPRSTIGIGTQYPAAASQLPRSHTSAAHLGTAGCQYHRPLPADPQPPSRRSVPYTAYRT